MVLTVSFALSSVTSSFCHRRRRICCCPRPVGPGQNSADLTPATGARTTRLRRPHMRRSSCVPVTAHGEQSALRSRRTPDAAASTASRLASVTIANRPSVRRDGADCKSDLGESRMEIFLPVALDRTLARDELICPTGYVAHERKYHRLGGAKRYPSIFVHESDGFCKRSTHPTPFRLLGPSYMRDLPTERADSLEGRIDSVDGSTIG